MAMLDVQDLRAGYGSAEILKGVSFRLEAHTLTGILGVNGSGKTTLLKALCGITPSTGRIQLCGRDAGGLSARERAKLSRYIPQRTGISIDISVLDVALMGFNPSLGLLEQPNAAMRSAAEEALARVGLADRMGSNFLTLSEGQKQLCILARTLLLEKGVLFLDEPESALDFSGRYRILEIVRQWLKEREGSALVTLHDPQLALNTCDRLLLLRGGVLAAELMPGSASVEEMEEKLSGLFGDLSVHTCVSRSGAARYVLVKEE